VGLSEKGAALKLARVLVAGPLGAGKTTFISTMCSDGVFISTDRRVTSPVERRIKEKTTVAFDYGCTCWNEIKLVFYGTPGQKRFFYFIPVLIKRCDYLIFMVDWSSPPSVYRGRALFERYFRPSLGRFRDFVVAANKADLPSPLTLADVAGILAVDQDRVVQSVATSRKSCTLVVSKLLGLLSSA